MKLSQLLVLREHLLDLRQQTKTNDAWALWQAHLMPVLQVLAQQDVPDAKQAMADTQSVHSSLNNLCESLDRCQQDLDQRVIQLEPEYYQRSQELYRADLVRTQKVLADIKTPITEFWHVRSVLLPQDRDVIAARLHAFNDWRIPGLIIRPGLDDWIEKLTGLDPLYLLDLDTALLRPALERFPPLYQRRLRQYTVDETEDHMLSRLPQGQFGLIFCYDFFRSRPLDKIHHYLSQCVHLLRPGGRMLFTYSNGDSSKAAELVERGVNCYTPAHKIRGAWQDLGYHTEFEHQSDMGWNLAEISRPGSISTLRGGQSVGQICPIV